ncbi:uncharacterized protein [Anoplolepis gracilipes]|uniref:uncharacterized protein n=1 Tax=Anoplolepis gracilipes TaxID=354296 RepID=UPI003BA1C70E
MAYLKLLLNTCLMIIAATTFLWDNNLKNNLYTAINISSQRSLRPLTYEIEIYDIAYQNVAPSTEGNTYEDRYIYPINKLNIEKQQEKNGFFYHSKSTMDVLIDNQTKTICLHMSNLHINESLTQLILDNIEYNPQILKPIKHSYNKKEQTVVLHFADYILTLLNIKSNFVICKLVIVIRGRISDNQEGFFVTSYIEEEGRHLLMGAVDFQMIGARQVFPHWDETTLNIKFLFYIKHEIKYAALSNAPIKMCTDKLDIGNITWTCFYLTDEMSPYFVTFIVYELPLLREKCGIEMFGRQYMKYELKFAWDIVANVTFRSEDLLYSKRNKTDLRIADMNHVAMPGFRDETMGSFRLVYYSEADITYDKALDPIACKIKIAQIVARKMVLLLFENMVSLPSWSHLWLSEGIATFMGTYIADQVIPDFRMMDLFVVQTQHESLRLNTYYDVPLIEENNTISEIKPLLSLPRYLKAPVFMRMLQHVMTNDSYLYGLNSYLGLQFNIVKDRSPNISKLIFDNFWIAIRTSLETHGYEADLKEKFENWMVQGHYPVLNTERGYNEKDKNYVLIKLSHKDSNKSYLNKWWIPVTYATKTKPDFTKTCPDKWLKPQIPFFKVPLVAKDEWIVVNIQQAGYYRVQYDQKNWQLIADYLRFENHTRIHVLNRAQIIDDSFYFLSTNQISFSLFKNLTSYLSKETDYIAWYPMFKIFEQISGFLPYQESAQIKKHMLMILDGLLDKIGYKEISSENALTVCLRQEAAKWACTFGSSVCKIRANEALIEHVFDSVKLNSLPGWQHWKYCRGLMIAKMSVWKKMLALYYITFNKTILEFLTCSEDFVITVKYVRLIWPVDERLSFGKSLPNIVRINIFHSLIAKLGKHNLMLDLFLNHFYFIKFREISTSMILTNIINHVYSEKQISKIRNFLYNNSQNILYISALQRKLEIRLSEIKRQTHYFQGFLIEKDKNTLETKIDMAYLKLLLNTCLIITATMAFLSDNDSKNNSSTAININLQRSLRPLTYEIEIYDIAYQNVTPSTEGNTYEDRVIYLMNKSNIEKQQEKSGFVYHSKFTMDVLIDNQTKTICLHMSNLHINESLTQLIFIDNIKSIRQILKPIKHLYNEKEQTVVLHFADYILTLLNIKSNFVICKLVIVIRGRISDNQEGFFVTSYIEEEGRHLLMGAVDFQVIGARQVLPYWKETTLNITFLLYIEREQKYTVLSNAPIEPCIDKQDFGNITWTCFHLTDEITPYFIFIVSELPLLSRNYGVNMWGRQYVIHELKFAWDIVASVRLRSKDMLYSKRNETYVRILDMNHVAIPGFRDEDMGSSRLVYYSEAAIIYDEKVDPIACKIRMAQIVARKTVLVLFGNMFPLSSWLHQWLNEGIVTFMGTYIADQVIPDYRMMNLFVVQTQHESLRLNTYYDVPLIEENNTISEIKSLSSLRRYLKAPVFMRMLQHVMTNESFLLGLNSYLDLQFNIVKDRSPDISKLIFDNFWIAIKTSLETHGYEANLKEKFDNWMVHGHYPVVNIKRHYNEENNSYVTIKLSHKGSNELYLNKWWIPVTYATKTKPDFTKTCPDNWLKPQTSLLKVPLVAKDEWIIVNIQQTGYYRVKYDKENWRLIANYLRFENHTRIHVLNRAQIIDDSFHFLSKNQLSFHMFKKLTAYLSNETDYIAWYPMFKIFEQISGFLPHQESAQIKKHMLKILDGLLEKIGYEEIFSENALTVCLRQEAAKWACIFGSSVCKKRANEALIKHIFDSVKLNFLPGWQHWTYCRGLMEANKSFWDKMLGLYITTLNKAILEFLTCSEDLAITKQYFQSLSIAQKSLISDKYLPNIIHINILHSLIARRAKDNLVLDFLLNHFYSIKPKEISTIVILTNIINHVYSREQIYKIRNFIYYNSQKLISYISALKQKVHIRLSEIERQTHYFQGFLIRKSKS